MIKSLDTFNLLVTERLVIYMISLSKYLCLRLKNIKEFFYNTTNSGDIFL